MVSESQNTLAILTSNLLNIGQVLNRNKISIAKSNRNKYQYRMLEKKAATIENDEN